MDSTYKKMKDQLLSDTIPVSDQASNGNAMRRRLLTRPRVGIIDGNDKKRNQILVEDILSLI